MAHEHQRWERDEYVYFLCENVRGMTELVDGAYNLNGKPNGITKEEVWEFLCEDAGQVEFWSAPSQAWLKGDGFDEKYESTTLDGPDGFDYDSIMMYGSAQGVAVDYSTEVNINTASLVKVKNHPDTGKKDIDQNDWFLPVPMRVSEKDAAFVRRFYPWGQPWSPPQKQPEQQPSSPPKIDDPPYEPQGPKFRYEAPSKPPPGTPPPVPPRPAHRPAKPPQE